MIECCCARFCDVLNRILSDKDYAALTTRIFFDDLSGFARPTFSIARLRWARVCLPIRQAKLDRFARRGGKGRGRCGWLSNL